MAFDAHYSNVNLWLQGDGENNSTAITDSSGAPCTLTRYGGVKISTAQSHRGGSSVLFNGSTDYLKAPTGTPFAFGTGDFTVEAWVRLGVVDGITRVIYDGRNGTAGSAGGISISVVSGSLTCDTNVANVLSGGTLVADTWYHVALTRASGTFKLWLDGVQVSTSGAAYNFTDGNMSVGAYNGIQFFNGYVDDFRITKGVARYTTAFDPADIAYETYGSSINAPSPTASGYGGGYASLSAPTPSVYGGDARVANITVIAPSPVVFAGSGIALSLTAPKPTLHATAHNSYGDNAAFITAPKPQLSIFGGGRATLTAPSPNLTSTATGTALAVTNLTAPSPTVEALGTVSNVANISITIPGPNVLAYAGAVCSVTIAGVTVQATGTGGGVAHAAITIPLFQLDAQGTAQNHGGANISAPMPVLSTGGVARLTIPMATLTAIGTATVVATYEAYAMNMRHTPRRDGQEPIDEVTHYTNFPFTHIVRYKNSYFGANSTGLYLLEGTTDDGVEIDWAFKTGMTDFDSPQQKTVTYAYFGGRMGPDATVSIYPSEPSGNSYSYTTPRGQTAQNYRQQFGKGLKARYYAIGASGSDALELDSLDLTIATLTRRI